MIIKKYKIAIKKIFSLSLFLLFLINNNIYAQSPELSPILEYNTFEDLINHIITFLLWIAVPVASLMIIIAAFIMLTGGGNPEKIKQAKNMIIWALVGLIIIFLSIALVNFLKAILGVRQ
ncbi:MAG TPA: pilin [Candidatus Pacearchaeota archaeon]|nr:pilin [Candidatus Pacearchaeota archaeon]